MALALPAAAAASPHGGADVKHKVGKGTSSNWSGYAVPGTNATHVIGTWTQPTATCSKGEKSWSSPWVGIDGDNSNSVEQIGTDTDCSNGKPYYYAWYEMYPKSLVVIPNLLTTASFNPSKPPSFTGEVTGNAAGTYVLKLTNNSTGASFTTTQTSTGLQRSSVEWVMEGPGNKGLTNFTNVGFTGASATISGQTGALGSFTAADPITMTNNAGTITRAVPGPIGGAGSDAFAVTWFHS